MKSTSVQACHDQLVAARHNLLVHYRYSDKERDGDYYFCGPKPVIVNICHGLLEWETPGPQVCFEFFGPREKLKKRPVSLR
jgi:ferredoxin-NADP reductase